MSSTKITSAHLQRMAYVYIRQSSQSQIECNIESTRRQYALTQHAKNLGWSEHQIKIIDEDLGLSGSESSKRNGFLKMTADAALGLIGMILSIEVSRVARNNSEWYRLLDLCAITNTLIGDEDGIYHPGLFNDRLLLGLKGTMAEAELHVLRARLNGGIKNKASRGELRRGLPVGFIWGEKEGEILIHPDQSVSNAIKTVFDKFTEFGSARRVWLWFRNENIQFPRQVNRPDQIHWETPTYIAIHSILKNPVYAGVYAYGKTKTNQTIQEDGTLKKQIQKLPQKSWLVFLPNHHEGYIDWNTFEANQKRMNANTRPKPHQTSGAIREGAALLQGIAVCGKCSRKLRTYYQGSHSTPGYYCANNQIVNGRGEFCMRIGAVQIDQAIAKTFLEAIKPAGIKAAFHAQKQLTEELEADFLQWKLQLERIRYEAKLAQKKYDAVDPENRLVAQTLEQQWEKKLQQLGEMESDFKKRQQIQNQSTSSHQHEKILSLASDLQNVWNAETTSDQDRKSLLRTVIEEVIIYPRKTTEDHASLTIRWQGKAISDLKVPLPIRHQPTIKTNEKTLDLIRRLAIHYNDAIIAGILNRQKRKTAQGFLFNANRVGNIRRHWNIPKHVPSNNKPKGEIMNVQQAAKHLGIAPSTIHRWLNDGFISGEQLTPGAPWRIRMNQKLRSLFVDETPQGYVTMQEATKRLGVSRQTILQRVKRGELTAVHVRLGKRKGLKIKALDQEPTLFNHLS